MSRWRYAAARWSLLAVAALASPLLGADVVQVEEDWRLVVGEVDDENVAPQITLTIAPTQSLNSTHAVLELNHKTVPDFAAGGVHLQLWVGDTNLTRKSAGDAVLAVDGETISWTTRMKIQGGGLSVAIVNGSSTTWGTFGGASLTTSYGTSLKHLNDYAPERSVANAGIGYAANRVQSLKLLRVRYTYADGGEVADNAPRVVHELSD